MSGKKDVDAWDLEYTHLEWGGVSDAAWIKQRLLPGRVLLDAGCGTGRYVKEFFPANTCFALDFSKQAVFRSAESTASFYGRLSAKKKETVFPEFIIGDIAHLPFSGGFDTILCLGVLQHLTANARKTAVSEFFRVLQPKGLVFFEAFGTRDMRFGSEQQNESPEPNSFVRQNGIFYHYFEENEVIELFEKNGFETVEIKSVEKEKKYDGKTYIRHHIRGVFEKRQ
ncbi:methyltransferase domain-containing protein [Methanolapillus millepedarum]|uniref:Methyltransferase type 11 domain-containing protein n=1 Tax=Methanolapillus millepedarum TaxID=3028296 RepID=A0AA96V681_9EURY|nr:hypothetical protein MsAc7_14270 [Methanosarcinaceae archaeon Ac7]